MSEIAKTVGQRIRNYRTQLGYSQEKLAELSGCHPTYIGQLERGEKNATLESVEKISSALGVTLSKLFEMIGDTDSDAKDIPRQCYEFIAAKTPNEQEQIYKILIEMDKYNAIASITGSLAEALGAFGESNKELVILQRTLAVAEVLIAQAVAIANAVKKATTDPTNFSVWQMIAAIGTSVAAVTGAIASAFSALDDAKFARGGYISGAGTSTSDTRRGSQSR